MAASRILAWQHPHCAPCGRSGGLAAENVSTHSNSSSVLAYSDRCRVACSESGDIVCPYLDTINRKVLDFDFEKLCSVRRSPCCAMFAYPLCPLTGDAVEHECVRVSHLRQVLRRYATLSLALSCADPDISLSAVWLFVSRRPRQEHARVPALGRDGPPCVHQPAQRRGAQLCLRDFVTQFD